MADSAQDSCRSSPLTPDGGAQYTLLDIYKRKPRQMRSEVIASRMSHKLCGEDQERFRTLSTISRPTTASSASSGSRHVGLFEITSTEAW